MVSWLKITNHIFGDNECPDAQQKAHDHLMNHKMSSPIQKATMMMTTAMQTWMELKECDKHTSQNQGQ